MGERIYNFSAGPAMLPEGVLEQAREEMLSFHGVGMSVMEMSHRSSLFSGVLESAEGGIRRLLDIPENYRVLFLQGGASMQFAMVPMNFLTADGSADYIVTGAWGRKAVDEARHAGRINVIYSGEQAGLSRAVPTQEELKFDPAARYVHYTSNETIDGVEFNYDLDGGPVPVVCDASSNILSKPIDLDRYSLMYAGAQKNIGPSGVTVVIISDEMLERESVGKFSIFSYRKIAEHGSMLNTPNTWGIYLIGLVCKWLEAEGGVSAAAMRNREKSRVLYDRIDASGGFYHGHAERQCRSSMNVTFHLPSSDLDESFCTAATEAGLWGLKGHRTVGGIRASIYNAFPLEGVNILADLMDDFARRNG